MPRSKIIVRASRHVRPLEVFKLLSLIASMWGASCLGANAADLRVMPTGLADGVITGPGINCGYDASETDCDETGLSGAIILTAEPGAESTVPIFETPCLPRGSTPTGGIRCEFDLAASKAARVRFDLDPTRIDLASGANYRELTVAEIEDPDLLNDFLGSRPYIDTPARFLDALPDEYQQNWIMMTRSESLQTGVASMPRFLLPSADVRFTLTFGLAESVHFPASHPNAIEFMQWDGEDNNFRFHEIVLADIDPMNLAELPALDLDTPAIPRRPRGVKIDDEKCFACHSTQNVKPSNDGGLGTPLAGTAEPGTSGARIKAKGKPNWDPYDSWAGMTPFNRDRIYKGSIEAAAFRRIQNPWTWRDQPEFRRFIEQLQLQPTGISENDRIDRDENGGARDGEIVFAFDDDLPFEPANPPKTNYNFDGRTGTGSETDIHQGGARGRQFVVLQHSRRPMNDEGRGIVFFDLLNGSSPDDLNPRRIADEIVHHYYATGSHPFDPRPLALAVAKGCFRVNDGVITDVGGQPISRLGFFNTRYNPDLIAETVFEQVRSDTVARAISIPIRKADLQKRTFDRTGDIYQKYNIATRQLISEPGLIAAYDAVTKEPISVARLRAEVFRRPLEIFRGDQTVMEGIYVDREDYRFNHDPPSVDPQDRTIGAVPLYRYFLEPLGISVDKWSTGVRGRSRTYSFADLLEIGGYNETIANVLERSITTGAAFPGQPGRAKILEFTGGGATNCAALITHLNAGDPGNAPAGSLKNLPDDASVPTYTDIQRILNKSCIECHGGLDIPPYKNRGIANYAENPNPDPGDDRLTRSHANFVGTDKYILSLLEMGVAFVDDCESGIMPCEGPKLSQTDIETIRRWIDFREEDGNSRGDPHINTIDGVNYDFQAGGEFTLLRGQGIEIQARQTPVATQGTIYDDHTDLAACVSINTAVAMKVGRHRITYQPSGRGDEPDSTLELRIDGALTPLDGTTTNLSLGVRLRSLQDGGIYVDTMGGGRIAVKPSLWDHHQLWFMNVETQQVRASSGLMGQIAPGNWLPALPDGRNLGARPADVQTRYSDLYTRFGGAWRVTNESSLFNYAPGYSTANYTFPTWPLGTGPSACVVPPWDVFDEFRVGPPIETIAPRTPAPEPITRDEAERLCEGVVEPAARENCIADVAATGEAGFAASYRDSETFWLNERPAAPVLEFPLDRYTDRTPVATPVQFKWLTTEDADAPGMDLVYRHCVWEYGAERDFNNCVEIEKGDAGGGITLPGGHVVDVDEGLRVAGIVALIGFLIFLLCVFFLLRGRYWPLAIVALLILLAIICAFFAAGLKRGGAMNGVMIRDMNLEQGKDYYWNVVVEDADGGIVHSELRRFEVQ